MGESSPSLLSSMWFLLALPALVAGQCQVNLDKVNGKYPPLLLQNSQFIFPTEKVGEERVLNFEEADSLDLFCHGGSDEKQARIFVRRSDKSKRDSKVSLTCKSGEFLVSGSEEKIAVEKATCNQKQEPRLDRKQEQCAPVGDDGRTDKLESLQRVSIGLNDPDTNVAPVELCKNRCSEMSSWVDWGIENLDAGYMYCCSVEDAAKAIKAIPDMTAPGGLIGGSSSPSTGGGDFSATGSCQAGPCQCSCAKNDQGVYTCTCTCNN